MAEISESYAQAVRLVALSAAVFPDPGWYLNHHLESALDLFYYPDNSGISRDEDYLHAEAWITDGPHKGSELRLDFIRHNPKSSLWKGPVSKVTVEGMSWHGSYYAQVREVCLKSPWLGDPKDYIEGRRPYAFISFHIRDGASRRHRSFFTFIYPEGKGHSPMMMDKLDRKGFLHGVA